MRLINVRRKKGKGIIGRTVSQIIPHSGHEARFLFGVHALALEPRIIEEKNYRRFWIAHERFREEVIDP